MIIFRELLHACWKYRIFYALAFLFLLITNGFAVLIPYAAKLAIDQSFLAAANFKSYTYPLWILVFALCQFLFRTMSRICVYRACREQEHDLRVQLMDCVEHYPMDELQRVKRGDLVTNMIEDTSQVRALAGFGFIQVGNILVAYLFCVPMMLAISVKLTLVSVLFYPFLLVFIGWMNQRLYYRNLEVKEKLGELTDFCGQVVEGIHVPKSFHAHQGLGNRFQTLNDSHFLLAWKTALLDILLLPGLVLIASLGEWAVIRYGSEMILLGSITPGDFLAFHGYIGYLLFASIAVGFGVSTFNRGYTSYSRLKDRFEVQSETGEQQNINDVTPTFQPANLRIEEVEFRYPGSQKTSLCLNELELPIRGLIGICGSVGSGKSTFLKILIKLHDLTSGSLKLDGRDLLEIPTSELRYAMSLVDQDPFLLSRTIRENIEFFAHRELSQELRNKKLEMSVNFAALGEDLDSFPDGLDTLVGERGVRLSLGQKQRVCIARAIFRERPILLFDDPFSSLDTVTEERILNNLLDHREIGATFLVSQRASTLNRCDDLLVFHDGRLQAHGPPKELSRAENFFAHIFELQKSLEGA